MPRLYLYSLFPFVLIKAYSVTYNEIRQKSAHNTFERDEQYADVLLHHHIRSVEFDIHNAKEIGQWNIYHEHLNDPTSVRQLTDGVKLLQQFHDLNPNHEVVTVFVDIKNALNSNHTSAQFDEIISTLPLWTPVETMGKYSSLSEGILKNGWPSLSSLRGKFIFVITDHIDCETGCYVSKEDDAYVRKAFVALQDMSSYITCDYKVFYNLEYTNRAIAATVHANGFVSRVYKSGDGVSTSEEWNSLVEYKVNHLATNLVNYHEYSWSMTHNTYGYPFQAISEDIQNDLVVNYVEDISVITSYVATGDIEGKYDDFAFRYTDIGNELQVVSQVIDWTAQISNSNSYVEEWAKGCIMARQYVSGDVNNYEGSPYFAICRPADDHYLRVQYRMSKNDDTFVVEGSSSVDGIDNEGRINVKLVVEIQNNSTICQGYFSTSSGEPWFQIGSTVSFSNIQLRYHGLAASSHGHSGTNQDNKCQQNGSYCVKHDFVNVRRNNQPQTVTSFPYNAMIGNVARESVWMDGF